MGFVIASTLTISDLERSNAEVIDILSGYISQNTVDKHIFTIIHEYEVIYGLSNGTINFDLQ